MAHAAQRRFVELARDHFLPLSRPRVLEVGSYNVNGSVRDAFPSAALYVGVDVVPGPGVDAAASGDMLPVPDESFDAAVSCECFEHNPRWRATLEAMHRATAPGGLVIVTCAGRGRPEHGTPRTTPGDSPGSDYYRNLTARDFSWARPLFQRTLLFEARAARDLYFLGWKGGAECDLDPYGRPVEYDVSRFLAEVAALDADVPQPGTLGRLREAPMALAAGLLPDPIYQNVRLRYMAATEPLRRLVAR